MNVYADLQIKSLLRWILDCKMWHIHSRTDEMQIEHIHTGEFRADNKLEPQRIEALHFNSIVNCLESHQK